MNLKGEFVIRIGDKLYTYENTDDIPQTFDNLIKFNPIPIEPPHTQEQHDDIAKYMDVFKEIASRESKKTVSNF